MTCDAYRLVCCLRNSYSSTKKQSLVPSSLVLNWQYDIDYTRSSNLTTLVFIKRKMNDLQQTRCAYWTARRDTFHKFNCLTALSVAPMGLTKHRGGGEKMKSCLLACCSKRKKSISVHWWWVSTWKSEPVSGKRSKGLELLAGIECPTPSHHPPLQSVSSHNLCSQDAKPLFSLHWKWSGKWWSGLHMVLSN